MVYLFGSRNNLKIEAKNLELATLKFACKTDNIYQHIDEESYKKLKKDPYYNPEVELPKEIKEKAFIEVREQIGISSQNGPVWSEKPIKKIMLSEIESLSFHISTDVLKDSSEEESNNIIPVHKEVPQFENLPAEFKEGKIKIVQDFSDKKIQIHKAIKELEFQQRQLNLQLQEMNKWLESKFRVICAYETYLGTHEEITELIGEGETSTKPIHFYQRVLFMDEEYGLVGLENLTDLNFLDEKDFDYKDIKFFDEWIIKNFKTYIPEERGIRMWRIKRRGKNYSDQWVGMFENEINKNCYFLIRNGERLYRIFSNVQAKNTTMFPTENQMQRAGRPFGTDSKYFNQEEYDREVLPWKYTVLALQGLLDRTDILGTDCQLKYNLLAGTFDSSKIVLVRDSEQENLIEDKTHLKFKEYLSQNQTSTEIGDKIILTDLWYTHRDEDFPFIESHQMNWRRTWIIRPSVKLVYRIQDIQEFKGVKKYKILYFEDRWSNTPRKRRTACWLNSTEFFNLSKTTEEEIMFYLKDRREREKYLDILPKMTLAYKYLKAKVFDKKDYLKKSENQAD